MSNSAKTQKVRQVFSGDEVSLLELIGLFADRKHYILYTVAVFFVLGALIALTSPYEYEAKARILSENDGKGTINKSLGALQNLIGFSGTQVGQSNLVSGLSADMYPEIIKSEPFLLDMMQEEFFFQSKGKRMSIQDYLLEERPGHIFSKMYGFLRGIPGQFFSFFEQQKNWESSPTPGKEVGTSVKKKKLSIANISSQQHAVINQLDSRLEIEAGNRIITLKVRMPEPLVSAELNVVVLEKIIEYVVKHRTEKKRDDLQFIEERYKEAELRFKATQYNLASFRDSHRGISSEIAKSREEQLQAEFNLNFTIYRGLAEQLEQSKIQLKKDTPLFTEFEPVSVPLTKASPNVPRIMIIYLISGFLSGFLAIIIVIFRDYRTEVRKGD